MRVEVEGEILHNMAIQCGGAISRCERSKHRNESQTIFRNSELRAGQLVWVAYVTSRLVKVCVSVGVCWCVGVPEWVSFCGCGCKR